MGKLEMEKMVEKLNYEIVENYWPGYVHAYPHKRAYRRLNKNIVENAWNENINALNIYVHIPFCNKKCAYCNLFSTVWNENEREKVYETYVDKLIEEIEYYSGKISGNVKIKSLFFGGGTPTVLSTKQIGRIVEQLRKHFHNWDENVEACIEAAPNTLNYDYIKELYEIGFRRISIGIQSFNEHELNVINRAGTLHNIVSLMKIMKELKINSNIDLIYGLPDQNIDSIFNNIDMVLALAPETITIYPLAIRGKTGIDKIDDTRMMSMQNKYDLYDTLRNRLEQGGYTCQTVVRYIKNNESTYQQQRYEYAGIPTMGIGAGARSYAPTTHYCISYKVEDSLIKEEILAYLNADFSNIEYDGFQFNLDELKRKFVMLSMLDPCIDEIQYKNEFKSDLTEDFKDELNALIKVHLLEKNNTKYLLTHKGRKYSDIAANIFVSPTVQELYNSYKLE